MGLRDIERKLRSNSAYQRKEAEVLLDELDNMIENIDNLKKQLKNFEKKHEKELKTNKDYYAKVSTLRDELGLPQEIGVYEWKESASLKDRITGGGYYDQLGFEILELGKKIVSETGGIISVAELVLQINKSRPGKLVTPKDTIKAIESLVDAKLIQPLRKLSSGVLIVEFVSIELSDDQSKVLDLASRHGFLTRESLITHSNWAPERANIVLEELVKTGIALKDETYEEGTKYWFPSLGQ